MKTLKPFKIIPAKMVVFMHINQNWFGVLLGHYEILDKKIQ